MALPRVRCCNCTRARSIGFSLRKGDGLANWTVIAKDGADLPPDQVQTAKAQFTITVGETRDVTFSTPNAEDIQLELLLPAQKIHVMQTLSFLASD